jgi:hypothetical protein
VVCAAELLFSSCMHVAFTVGLHSLVARHGTGHMQGNVAYVRLNVCIAPIEQLFDTSCTAGVAWGSTAAVVTVLHNMLCQCQLASGLSWAPEYKSMVVPDLFVAA